MQKINIDKKDRLIEVVFSDDLIEVLESKSSNFIKELCDRIRKTFKISSTIYFENFEILKEKSFFIMINGHIILSYTLSPDECFFEIIEEALYKIIFEHKNKIIDIENLRMRRKNLTNTLLVHGDQDDIVSPTHLLETKDFLLREKISRAR